MWDLPLEEITIMIIYIRAIPMGLGQGSLNKTSFVKSYINA